MVVKLIRRLARREQQQASVPSQAPDPLVMKRCAAREYLRERRLTIRPIYAARDEVFK